MTRALAAILVPLLFSPSNNNNSTADDMRLWTCQSFWAWTPSKNFRLWTIPITDQIWSKKSWPRITCNSCGKYGYLLIHGFSLACREILRK
jgi:hypothetical protein